MKPVRKLSSYVLLVGVMGLSIVGGVVAYQLYSASFKTQTTKQQSTAIKPLDGVINKTTIDILSKRTVYSDTVMETLLAAPAVIDATGSAVTPIIEQTQINQSTSSATQQ